MSNKFSQLVFQGHLWRSVLRICIWILGIKGFKTLFIVQEEEKKRQEKEELLSKKLHEEQALHEAQLKEVSSLHLIWNQIQYWRIWWLCRLLIYLFVCLFVCLFAGTTIIPYGSPSCRAWVRMYRSSFQSSVSTSRRENRNKKIPC